MRPPQQWTSNALWPSCTPSHQTPQLVGGALAHTSPRTCLFPLVNFGQLCAKHKSTLKPLWRSQHVLHHLHTKAVCLPYMIEFNVLEHHTYLLVIRWTSGSGNICNPLQFVCSNWFTPNHSSRREKRKGSQQPWKPSIWNHKVKYQGAVSCPDSCVLLCSHPHSWHLLWMGSGAQWSCELTQLKSNPAKTPSHLPLKDLD